MTDRMRLTLATVVACIGADMAFGALFNGWGWLAPTVLVVIVVIGVSESVRRSRLPSALGPLLAAIATLFFVCILDAPSQSIAGFLPGHSARKQLIALLHSGAKTVHHYASPVPDRTGAVLLAVVAIAAVTLVVDLCVLTLDRTVLAGIPLLAVYFVSALLTHHGVGWAPFLFVSIGFLLLIAADAQLARDRWGRRFGDRPTGSAQLGGGIGRQLAASALLVAVVIPLAIPRLHADLPTQTSAPNNNIVTINPIVSIDQELHSQSGEPLITYTTTAQDPRYLRLTALDFFDGVSFSAVTLRQSTSIPVGTNAPLMATPSGSNFQTSQISVSNLDAHWTPVPEGTTNAAIPGSWLYDPGTQTIWSAKSNTVGLNYTTTSTTTEPTAKSLSAVSYADIEASGPQSIDLGVPSSIPQSVINLAHRLRRSTPYATAVAIQNHFIGGEFKYDLNVPATSSSAALTNFLFTTHAGFCQQFSASMAVLARIDGIPARVAVGFTAGTKQPSGDWTIDGADAHAWPELDFSGIGWVPFEPTPRTDGQAVIPAYAVGAGPKANKLPSVHKNGRNNKPNRKLSSTKPTAPHHKIRSVATEQVKHSSNNAGLIALAVILVLLLAAGIPAALRLRIRRQHSHQRDAAAAAHAAWDEVRDTVIDLGGHWPAGCTPRRSTEMLLREVPELALIAAPLERIALAEQQARYATTVTVDVGDGLQADVQAVREALMTRAGRNARLRAMVLPRSSLESLLRNRGSAGLTGRLVQPSKRRWKRSSSRAMNERRGPVDRDDERRGSLNQR